MRISNLMPKSAYHTAPRMGQFLLGLCLLFSWLPNTAISEIRIQDDLGNTIHLAQPAQRIISLAPHATELLFAAGAGNKLVGVSEYSDYPPAARHIARIGGHNSFDLERILALQPDLIIGWHSGNTPRTLQTIAALGFPIYHSEPRQLQDIPHTIEQLGKLAGTSHTAQMQADFFRLQLQKLASQYQHKATIRVFYQIWHQPLLTLGGQHLINEVIRLCGGENIFVDLKLLSASVSQEDILLRNPDIIITSGGGRHDEAWAAAWQRWPQLTAVETGQIHAIHPDLLQRPTLRLLHGASAICQALDSVRH